MNLRIEIFILQIVTTTLRITAGGRYIAHCDIDGSNAQIDVRIREAMPHEQYAEMTREQRIASWFFKQTIYFDGHAHTYALNNEQVRAVCSELEALAEQLLPYCPPAKPQVTA
ncbi:hypothetical protein [uncultured Stutzerimonas sp.]|uniref:hypothetical protein n=1 Tax=uncultured Stutzerimonas sp. TaxID=2901168 RepID=UPI0032B14CAE|tara:strand:- start:3870 stop:4208 length:339 start_codon:yes stop_codon:yes gene_type:complete